MQAVTGLGLDTTEITVFAVCLGVIWLSDLRRGRVKELQYRLRSKCKAVRHHSWARAETAVPA